MSSYGVYRAQKLGLAKYVIAGSAEEAGQLCAERDDPCWAGADFRLLEPAQEMSFARGDQFVIAMPREMT